MAMWVEPNQLIQCRDKCLHQSKCIDVYTVKALHEKIASMYKAFNHIAMGRLITIEQSGFIADLLHTHAHINKTS